MDDSTLTWPARSRAKERVGTPLDRYFVAAAAADGLDVRELSAGDELLVHTCYSTYRLLVEEASSGQVRATSDGKILTESVPCRFLGASLSGRGSMLRLGWALIGYKVVMRLPDGELLTSKVCGLTLNGRPIVTTAPGVQ